MPLDSRPAASIACASWKGQVGSDAVGSTFPPNASGRRRSYMAASSLRAPRARRQCPYLNRFGGNDPLTIQELIEPRGPVREAGRLSEARKDALEGRCIQRPSN